VRQHPRIVLAVLVLLSGCAHPLKQWVEDRGYTFIEDYSTINVLGRQLTNAGLTPNRFFTVPEFGRVPGQLPDCWGTSQSVTVSIEGQAAAENVLKRISNLRIGGKLDRVSRVELTLTKPHKEELLVLIPSVGLRESEEVSVVTKVLNTGQLRVAAYDSTDANITASLDLYELGTGTLGAESKVESAYFETGADYYVGYVLVEGKLSVTGRDSKVSVVPNEKPVHVSDEFGGVHAIFKIAEAKDDSYTLEVFARTIRASNPALYSGPTDPTDPTSILVQAPTVQIPMGRLGRFGITITDVEYLVCEILEVSPTVLRLDVQRVFFATE
jgi:hypothetical protein